MSVRQAVEVGTGTAVWTGDSVEGVVREVKTTEDVLTMLDEVPEDLVILLHTSGATILSPLFSDIKGIICTAGSVGSHVAIISREFGVACVVGTTLSKPDLDGKKVRLEPSGTVQLLTD